MRSGFYRSMVLAALLGISASPAIAQKPHVTIEDGVSSEVRQIVEPQLTESDVSVVVGDTTIGEGEKHSGSILQLGGALTLEGEVTGSVTAIDSEVTLRTSAVLGGDLIVVGGRYTGTTMADVGGRIDWRRRVPIEVVVETSGDVRIRPLDTGGFPLELRGFYGLVLYEYNRVDGLLLGFPRVGLKRRYDGPQTDLYGGPVFRTSRGDVGWDIGGSHEFSESGQFTLGGRFYSITDTRQRWHRPDGYNSVMAFLFANDFRVYYSREGYEIWGQSRLAPGVTARLTWVDDEFGSLDNRRPFALFASDEDWLDNPPIAPGRGRSLGLRVDWDNRDNPRFSTRGVFAEGRYEHWGLGGDFNFDWGQVDLRGYLPTSRSSFASARFMSGGRLGGGDSLPPQFWHRLGDFGTIPGYDPLTPDLTGDRMVLLNVRYHQAVAELPKILDRVYAVALGDAGDAWFPDAELDWKRSLGGGVAASGRDSYFGVFAAYGFESELWRAYLLVRQWF